jgi:hypothetical protein
VIPLIIGTNAHEETGFAVTSDHLLLKLTWEQLPGKVAAFYNKPDAQLIEAIAETTIPLKPGDHQHVSCRAHLSAKEALSVPIAHPKTRRNLSFPTPPRQRR